MLLNRLEQQVLIRFFESEGIETSVKDLSKTEVLSRDLTGSGFITQIRPGQIKITKGPNSFTGGRIGAKLNHYVDIGFVIYIQNGYVDAIEAYTEDGEWPEEINSFELNLINFTGQNE